MENVISAIGTDRFHQELFNYTHAHIAPFHQLIVMRFDHRHSSDILAVEVADRRREAAPFIALYKQAYHHRDPLHALQTPSPRHQICAKRLHVDEIEDVDYRHRLFTSAGFSSKLSIIDRSADNALAVSLYRERGSRHFSLDDLNWLQGMSSLLMAAVRRHDTLQLKPKPTIESITQVLRALGGARALTRREASVCAGVVLGYSNEALSLNLDISRHSVVTYRRRAYAKLNITSQNELFTLLLRQSAVPPHSIAAH